MPDMLTIAAGLMEGVKRATENFMNVSASMQERERQKRIDDLNFKQADLQIKKDEEYLAPEMIQARREQMKAQQRDSKVEFATDLTKLRKAKAEIEYDKVEKEQELGIYTLLMAQAGETPQGEPIDFTGVLPPGTTHKIGRYTFKGGRGKATQSEQLGIDVESLGRGEIEIEDLYRKYPVSKVNKKVEALLQPLPPDPRFEVHEGWLSSKDPHKAKLNEKTIYVLQQLRTEKDLKDVLIDQKSLEEEGVDVEAIKKYHADKFEAMSGGGKKKEASDKLTKFRDNFYPKGTPKEELPDKLPPGMIEPGNIDLFNRPVYKHADGSTSTVRSLGVNIEGKEFLIPTISDDGKLMTDDEAIQTFLKTKKHLGVFKDVASSNRYGEMLHNQQESLGMEEVVLPEEITKTSEAIDYLMEQEGMTEDEAIDWIRSQ